MSPRAAGRPCSWRCSSHPRRRRRDPRASPSTRLGKAKGSSCSPTAPSSSVATWSAAAKRWSGKPGREFLWQIEACEEAGFRVPGSEYLPETGGPSLPMVAALERVMNFEQALLGSDCGGEVAVWKGLEHRWALRVGCG